MAFCCFSQASFFASQATKPRTVWNHSSARPVMSYNSIVRKEQVFLLGFAKAVLPRTRVCDRSSLRRRPVPTASLAGSSQIANSVFTVGTALVIPLYALMVFVPHSELTKRSMESSIPYIILGAMYTYLLGISWTSETLRLMFASKYWLPELPGITRMFSSDLTVASAWLHLLAVDLYAARQVFRDGLKDGIETRHSIALCLLFCPIGIMSHLLTKVIAHLWRRSRGGREAAESVATIRGEC
ncbi:hypothetical protein SUGI_1011220 [Cryptomeria japonica]|uniref:protein ABA DEFICIENT 4, chloroplastic n=1 Tax=Cryptomeria japonica TaxID=3369 RepID=UPI0024147A9E|nr:protein ABA DEFICIENT 4, chloroplastic [Cryptomeria japonica]GLJ47889.1 hypothetical protein SUGI_1011220 [Cryptomeria japonica]